MDFSTNGIGRQVGAINNHFITERQQDFAPIIEEVKRRRAQQGDKTHHRTSQLMSSAFLVPNSLVELLENSGIYVSGGGPEHYNFVHDWMKQNFPCFMIHPTKNMKIPGHDNAVPTKPIILNKNDLKLQ